MVVSDGFAGTERYVVKVAGLLAQRGDQVRVLGGDPARMPAALHPLVDWQPCATLPEALPLLARGGRTDIVHAHLTTAEAAAVATLPAHRGRVIATRHIAAGRGATPLARLLGRAVRAGISREIAISGYVQDRIGGTADVVLHHGVPQRPAVDPGGHRTVTLLQRLEPEKDTATGLRAWGHSGLADDGWRLQVAGAGAELPALHRLVAELGLRSVEWLGNVDDVDGLWRRTAVLLATTPVEAFGLSVVEAMAVGLPVVATGTGGHAETLPPDYEFLYAAGDFVAAAGHLRTLAEAAQTRQQVGSALRQRQQDRFDLDQHVSALQAIYGQALSLRRAPSAARRTTAPDARPDRS